MTTIKSRVTMRCLFIFLNAIGITGGLKAQAPVITSFSPASAIPGASVTLTGTGFNTATTNNIVFFGATRATVTAASATSITATVPTGATYAPITLLNTGTVLACASLSNFNPIYGPAKANFVSGDLSAKVDFTPGTNPVSVAIGDLDGDGKADLAVANAGSASVSVFRNTSSSGSIASGSFATKVDFTTGTQPYSVAIGDLDGDGKPDLAVANYGSARVSVFRNTSSSGSITTSSFATKVDFTTGDNPFSVAIGDLDGDGKPDLASANFGGASVSVFRNTSSSGSITTSSFATKVDFTTETNPVSMAIGDLDGDGKPDLAVTNYGSARVSVFRNTSSSGSITTSSFATKVDFTTGTSPRSVAIGDLDGDGKADLAVANEGSASVSVFHNTSSSGSIASGSFAIKVDFTTGTNAESVAIGDQDGDGKPDLVVANAGSVSYVSVFRNTSSSGSIASGSFATKVDFTAGSNPLSVAIGDLDGDGRPDLAVANYSATTVSVFRNADPTPVITSFSPASAIPGASVTLTGTGFNSATTNNIVFFGATRATVTAASATSITATVPTGATYAPITLLNTGTVLACASLSNFNPIYSPAKANFVSSDLSAKVDFTTGTNPRSVAIGDLDGDGKADLAVANAGSNSVSVFRNISSSGSIASGSFATKVDFATGVSPHTVAIGDLDGDGKPELAVANWNPSTVSVLRNTSTSGTIDISSFATKVDFTTGAGPFSVAIGDLDGDGKADLASANFGGASVSVFRNTSSSGSITTSSFATKVDFTTGSNPVSMAIGDLDGDAKPDLAVANYGSASVSVYRNTSSRGSIASGSFATKVDFTTGTQAYSVAIGDLDGDGKADLAVANNGSSTVSVFHNTSSSGSIASGSFATKVDFTTGTTSNSVAIGDLDGDGKPDLAVANGGPASVSVFRNTSSSGSIVSGSFATKVDFTTGTNPISVAIGDLDGDGRPELAVANYNATTVSVFRNADRSATWNGSVSTDWSTAANWTPNAVPAVGQLVDIPSVITNNYPAVPSDRTLSSLALASGASLNLNSNTLTLTSGLSNAGSISGDGKLTMGGSSAQSISGTGTVSNLEVNNSTGVTITSGAGNMQSITGVLTPTAGTLTTNGNLTLKSSASGTARVAAVPASGAAITGNVTVERYLPLGRKWRMLTAPLTGSSNNSVFYNWQNNDLPNGNTGVEIWGPTPYGTIEPSSSNSGLALGGGASMRSYGSSGWADVTSTTSTLLFDNTTNYGYALFATGPYNNGAGVGSPSTAAQNTTISATGTLITGTHIKTLSANPNAGQYFLVGNPYAAPVYVKDLSGANLTGTFYMWDAAEAGTYQLGKYVGFDRTTGLYTPLTAGIPDSSTRLQSGQAFFARADQAGANTTITFEEADKALTSSNGMFGNGSLSDFGMLRLTLQLDAGGKSYNADGAVALFHANGNPAIDRFDGSKLMNSGENLFIRRSNVNLMFEHRPEIQTKDTVFLRLSNMQPQSYRLQLETKDLGITEAYLIDAYTKKEMFIQVNGRTDYDFTVTADSLSTGDRFRVVFAKAAAPVTVTPDTDGGDVLKLYPNPVREKLRVVVGVSFSGPYTAAVFNAAGVEVWKKSGIAAGTKTVDVGTSAFLSGLYTLVLTDAKGETRVEKFVRE